MGVAGGKGRLGAGCILVGFCLFIGMMVATAGAALYPPLHRLAAPLVCAGELDVVTEGRSYRPGEYVVSQDVYCVTPDGARRDIGWRTMLVSTLIYAVLVPPVLLIVLVPLVRRRNRAFVERLRASGRIGPGAPGGLGHIYREVEAAIAREEEAAARDDAPAATATPAERLAELRRLRDAGLITAADYDAKKAEILAGL